MSSGLRQEGTKLREHRGWMLEDVAPGVAAVLVAPSVGLALAPAVLLPGVARGVVAVGIEFHRQAVLGPAAVDAFAPRGAVGYGQGQARCAEPLEKPLLQL